MPALEELELAPLTPLHGVGIVLALVSAGVHLILGIGFLPHWMGLAFFGATLGFLVGIGLVLVGRRRRLVYVLGIPFTGAQILLWYLLNRPAGVDALGPADIIDKTAQTALIVVLVVLIIRDS